MYPNNYFLPPSFGPDFDFFQTLRGYVKFSFMLLFFMALLLILAWNIQPWYEIEIKPANKLKAVASADLERVMYDRALQSDIKIVTYVVRPGDTLSEIAERHDVSVATLLRFNALENPNTLYAGQRLKIPRRLSR